MSGARPDTASAPWTYARPAPALSASVSHYWMSSNEAFVEHPILPDGRVDVVFAVGRITHGHVYGIATRTSVCSMEPGFHYVGVRFYPGQARHFLRMPAHHLTDTSMPIVDLAGMTPDVVADGVASGRVFERLDEALTTWLARQRIEPAAVDAALGALHVHHGRVPIDALAWGLGVSRRQLERSFRSDVGVSPKTYARIRRWQYAFDVLRRDRSSSLADVALRAGYADQSHMNREFRDLVGHTPRSVRDVAIVQDGAA